MALGIAFVAVRLQVGSDLSLQRRHQHPARPSRAISSSRELIRAVAETNLLEPKPDFVFFGGDLAQLGTKAELDHGAEIMSALRYETHYVMGEHDYYLDLGEYWSKLFDDQIDNITFHSVMATAWPWPYPQSYAQAQHQLPVLTVPINRADPFFERDATGWQFVDTASGRVSVQYTLRLRQHGSHGGLRCPHGPARGHDVSGPEAALPAAGTLLRR